MRLKKVSKNKELLAYIVGIALGDGNLSNPNGRGVRLRISCDLKYPKLIEKIVFSLKTLLPENRVSLVKRPSNCLDISCYSNRWPEFLGWKVGQGSKLRQDVDIPEWILSKTIFKVVCLRGLLETDGSIYSDRGYNTVMFVSAGKNLADRVYQLITDLGFKPKFYRVPSRQGKIAYHVRLARDVGKFLKLVKPEKV